MRYRNSLLSTAIQRIGPKRPHKFHRFIINEAKEELVDTLSAVKAEVFSPVNIIQGMALAAPAYRLLEFIAAPMEPSPYQFSLCYGAVYLMSCYISSEVNDPRP